MPAAPNSDDVKAAILAIQTSVKTLGYDPGPLDGAYGGKTKKGVQDWLNNNGKPAAVQGLAPVSSGGGMIHQGRRRHAVDEIVVHCTATSPEWLSGKSVDDKVAEIRRWHKAKNWSDIGYHYLIDRDGSVGRGRAETRVGAHVLNNNSGTLGVSLVGGHGASATDSFGDHFTPEQDTALRNLIQDIRGRTQIAKISGHNEYASKGCPGFQVMAWFGD